MRMRRNCSVAARAAPSLGTRLQWDMEEAKPFTRELECGGKVLKIKQLFLENGSFFPPGYWAPVEARKKVIDLGSGTGVAGIAAGVLGADVYVTDLPEFVPLMQSNIDQNSQIISGTVTAKTLTWGQDVSDFQPQPDVILMADVVYYEEASPDFFVGGLGTRLTVFGKEYKSLSNLLKTLTDLCSPKTTIIMSYEERTTGNKPEVEKKFFQLMDAHFSKTEVPYCKLDEMFRSHDIHVVLFTHKQ